MSIIPTQQISGDIALGRHATIGGDATISGSAKVRHNLKVEGWLEADNIRGASKGLYVTQKKLLDSYPQPQPGWWALVLREPTGASNAFTADVYNVVDGSWQKTAQSVTNITLDLPAINQLQDDLNGLVASMDAVEAVVTASNTNAAKAKEVAESAKTVADEAKASAETAQRTASQAVEISSNASAASATASNSASMAITESHEAKEVAIAATGRAETAVVTANTALSKANKAEEDSMGAVSTAEEANAIAEDARDIAGDARVNSESALSKVSKFGIKEFNSQCYRPEEISSKPSGYIAFCVSEGLFILSDGLGGYSVNLPEYNVDTRVGWSDINGDALFACGDRLYKRSGIKKLAPLPTYDEVDALANTRPATVVLSEEEYEALVASGEVVDGTLYMTYDGAV